MTDPTERTTEEELIDDLADSIEDDEEDLENDGQPTMYEEYQDLYGGDDFPEQWDEGYEGDW